MVWSFNKTFDTVSLPSGPPALLLITAVYSIILIFHYKYGLYCLWTIQWLVFAYMELQVLCNHQATSDDKTLLLHCFVYNDSVKTAVKTEAGVKARPTRSCLIAQLHVPRCPLSALLPYSVFQRQSSFSSFSRFLFFSLFNSFCNEYQSPSVWQTMSVCVPVLYVAYSEWTHVHALTGAWTILHIIALCAKAPASVSNCNHEAISQNKADPVTAPLNNLSSLFYPLLALIFTTETLHPRLLVGWMRFVCV